MIAQAGDALPPNWPEGITVLGLLGLVLLFFLRQMEKAHAERRQDFIDKEAEIAKLEAKCDALAEEAHEHRVAKHAALNRVTVLMHQRALARNAARRCTCGAMTAVLALIEDDDGL